MLVLLLPRTAFILATTFILSFHWFVCHLSCSWPIESPFVSVVTRSTTPRGQRRASIAGFSFRLEERAEKRKEVCRSALLSCLSMRECNFICKAK